MLSTSIPSENKYFSRIPSQNTFLNYIKPRVTSKPNNQVIYEDRFPQQPQYVYKQFQQQQQPVKTLQQAVKPQQIQYHQATTNDQYAPEQLEYIMQKEVPYFEPQHVPKKLHQQQNLRPTGHSNYNSVISTTASPLYMVSEPSPTTYRPPEFKLKPVTKRVIF